MTQQKIEELFRTHNKMIHQAAHRCAAMSGRSHDDCYGEACALFMRAVETYLPGRGAAFGTYLYTLLHHGLIIWGVKNDLPPDPASAAEPRTDLNPRHALEFKEWLAGLSEEAHQMLNIILYGPAELLGDVGQIGKRNGKVAVARLHRHLRAEGWKWRTIWKTVAEVKAALRVL